MKNTFLVIFVSFAVGAAGFWAGTKYQQSKRSDFARNLPANLQDMRGQFAQRGAQGLRPVTGEILSRDDQSLTVKLIDETSKIIILTAESQVNKTEAGALEDLAEGSQVTIFGQENSDGSLTAQNIQINTIFPRQVPENN